GSAHQGRFGLGHHADSRISAVALMNASGAGRREGAPVLVGGLASSVPQTPGALGNVMVNCEVGQTVRARISVRNAARVLPPQGEKFPPVRGEGELRSVE